MTTADAHRFTIRFPKSMWAALQAHLEALEVQDGYPTDATTLILKIISGYLRSGFVASNEAESINLSLPVFEKEKNSKSEVTEKPDKTEETEEQVATLKEWPPGKGEYIIEFTYVDQTYYTNTREDEWVKLEKFNDLDTALSMVKYYSLLFKEKSDTRRKFYRITHTGTTLYTMFYAMSKEDMRKRDEFFRNRPRMIGSSICGQSASALGHDRLRR